MQWAIRLLYAVLIIAFVIVGAMFCLHNNAPVQVDLLIVQYSEVPLFVWIMGSFIIGGLLGVMVSGFAIARLKLAQRGISRKLVRKEAEVSRLRSDVSKVA